MPSPNSAMDDVVKCSGDRRGGEKQKAGCEFPRSPGRVSRSIKIALPRQRKTQSIALSGVEDSPWRKRGRGEGGRRVRPKCSGGFIPPPLDGDYPASRRNSGCIRPHPMQQQIYPAIVWRHPDASGRVVPERPLLRASVPPWFNPSPRAHQLRSSIRVLLLG